MILTDNAGAAEGRIGTFADELERLHLQWFAEPEDGDPEPVEEPEDEGGGEEKPDTGLTEEQVQKLLAERDKKWQSKFDKLLQEKKETETKSKTAEERIAEIERRYEQERRSRVRERAISSAKLDAEFVEAAQALNSDDEESITNGASRLSELLEEIAERRAKERLEAEINKRFPKDKEPPRGGKKVEDMTYQELMQLSDSEIAKIPSEQLDAIIEKARKKTE